MTRNLEEIMLKKTQKLQPEFDRIPPLYAAEEIEESVCMVPMRDGTCLKTHIFRPKTDRPLPVLLTRSCYPENQIPDFFIRRELARRGFACVFQYCRGTGGSEGVWEPNVHERADGWDAAKWLNDAPWVESIGCFGDSYVSLTAWAYIDIVPEKVKGMYLNVYGTNRFVSCYQDGLFRHDIMTGWAKANAGVPIAADFEESCRFLPHVEVDRKLWQVDLPWYRDMITNPDRSSAFWNSGFWKLLRELPSKVKIPIVFEEGWFDHHLGSALSGYRSMTPEGKGKCLLRVGGWNHGKIKGFDGKPEPAHLENEKILPVYRFFKKLLLDRETPPAGVSLYLIGEDRWLNLPAWPEPTRIKAFYLNAAEKTLSEQPPEESSEISYLYDPADPMPTWGGEACLTSWGKIGSKLQSGPDFRPDVVSFISEPLAEPLRLIGKIRARLSVQSDAEDTAFGIKVMEVLESGEAYNVRTGMTTLAYRGHSDERQTYTPGATVAAEVETWDVAWSFAAGSRIRVDIISSDFPEYNIHANYPGVWSLQEKTRPARQTVLTGIAAPSALFLPVVENV